jgi:hypothetical protein
MAVSFPLAVLGFTLAGRISGRRTSTMSKNERQGPRKPATKFPNLRKKMQKQKVQVKQPKQK